MGKYAEKALELHAKGYNCAQAVACAFSDQVDMDEDQLFKVMEGFGAGMGGMHGTCGAISGAVAIVGLMNSKGNSQVIRIRLPRRSYPVLRKRTVLRSVEN